MSGKQRIHVEILHRGANSVDPLQRSTLGLSRFHWAIMLAPKGLNKSSSCQCFDVTDAWELTPDGLNLNTDMDWRFRTRLSLNPLLDHKFLGGVMIGKLPKATTAQAVEKILLNVPLPKLGQTPQQSCVTWMRAAILALQHAGFVESKLDVDQVMMEAGAFGDDIIEKRRQAEPELRFWNATSRAM